MANDESPQAPLTNEQLIAKAIVSLESDAKTDASLLKVLSEHILKLNPRNTAVQDAVSEIEALADKRAEEPED
ncbi:MAG: hypothetical protein QM706_03755 [Nitrospira sp.]